MLLMVLMIFLLIVLINFMKIFYLPFIVVVSSTANNFDPHYSLLFFIKFTHSNIQIIHFKQKWKYTSLDINYLHNIYV